MDSDKANNLWVEQLTEKKDGKEKERVKEEKEEEVLE